MAELWLRSDPSAAFYQMPARFWELAAGGLIAATPGRGLPSWTIPAGIMLTLVACALPLGHFPGVGALPAVAGATLVIAAVHGGNSNALLASRPMVGVGLISYSLYLWHWPLLAFDRLLRLGPTPLEVRVMLVALAVLLAVASYRYVETPLRRPWATSRRTVAAGFGLMAVLACGAWAARPSPVIVTAENFIARCAYMPMESLDKFPKAACSPTTGTKLTLWGDSMALAFQPGMALLDPKLGTFIRAGCPPAISFSDRRKATVQRDLCTGFQAKVVPLLRGDTLILAARWQIYPGIEAEMARTLAKVAPQFRRVLILGPTPSLRDDAPKCLAIGDPLACAIPRAEFQALTGQILAGLEAAAKPWPNVTVLDPGAYFCPTDQCTASRDGFPLYSDGFHPSRQAAEGYARQLRLGP